jgi:hypothetical protein
MGIFDKVIRVCGFSSTMYKNNGGNPAKTKGSNKNKLWSKLKKLWS